MKTNCISVAVIDSYMLIRHAYSHLMQNMGFNVILQAKNAEDFFKQAEHAIPDICLLDIDTNDIRKFVTAKHIKEKYPNTTILAYTVFERDYNSTQIKRHGIDAFLSKSCTVEQIKVIISGFKQTEYSSPA